MLAKKALNRIFIVTISLSIVLVVCSIVKIDLKTQKKYEYITSTSNNNTIYLPNQDDLIVISTIYIDENKQIEDQVKDVIEAMIKENNKNSLLPSDIKPILPRNTSIQSIIIENNILKIDFSKEFLNIEQEEFDNIMASITYTITSFEGIYGVEISADKEIIKYAPTLDTEMPTIFTRDYGINKVYNLKNTNNIKKVILYFLDNHNREVPITKYLNSNDEKINVIVKELATFQQNNDLKSYIDNDLEILSCQIGTNIIILDINKKLENNESINQLVKSVFSNYSQEYLKIFVNNNQFSEYKRDEI